MWQILSRSTYMAMLRQDMGIGSSPVTPPPTTRPLPTRTELQATSTAITNYAQQHPGQVSEQARTEASRDLVNLSQSGALSSTETQQVQSIQARVDAGQQLRPEDLQQLNSIIDGLQGQLGGTTGTSSSSSSTPPTLPPAVREHEEAGNTQFSQHHYAAAESEFQQALNSLPPGTPGNVQAPLQYNLAQAQEHQGNLSGAIENYNHFLANDPGSEQAGATREHVTELTQRAQHQSEEHQAAGNTQLTHYHYAAAETQYQQALNSLPPGSPPINQAPLQYNLAQAQEHQGNLQGAIENYQHFLTNDPGSEQAGATRGHIAELQSSVHEHEGAEQFTNHNYSGAAASFQQALNSLPPGQTENEASLRYNLGRSFEEQHMNGPALEQFNAYLNLHPNASDAGDVRERVRALGGEPPF